MCYGAWKRARFLCKSGVRTGRMLFQPQTSLYSAVKTLMNKLHTSAVWSSSANNNNNAWKQRFSDGNQNNNNKNNTNSVRAVRDFAQRQTQAECKTLSVPFWNLFYG